MLVPWQVLENGDRVLQVLVCHRLQFLRDRRSLQFWAGLVHCLAMVIRPKMFALTILNHQKISLRVPERAAADACCLPVRPYAIVSLVAALRCSKTSCTGASGTTAHRLLLLLVHQSIRYLHAVYTQACKGFRFCI